MAKFGDFKYGEEKFGTDSASPPSDIAAVRVPWLFTDYSLAMIYEFAVNPLEATMGATEKSLNTEPLAYGGSVIYEGQPPVQTITFSGTIISETQYLIMRSWVNEQKQVQVTDDLGQKYWVFFTRFSPSRKPRPGYPWMMEYSCEGIILDWGATG